MIFRSIFKNFWLVGLCAVIAVIAAILASRFVQPRYSTQARFILSPDSAVMSEQNDYLQSLNVLDKRTLATTFVEVLISSSIRDQVASTLQMSPVELEDYLVEAVVLPETNVVELTVEGPHPEITSLMATATGQQTMNYMANLYPGYSFNFLDRPVVPQTRSNPQPVQTVVISMILGAVVGMGLAVLKDLLPRIFYTPAFKRMRGERNAILPWNQFERRLNESAAQKSRQPFSLAFIQMYQPNEQNGVNPVALEHLIQQSTQIIDYELRQDDLLSIFNKHTFAVLLAGTDAQSATAALNRVRLSLSHQLSSGVKGKIYPVQPRISMVTYTPGATANQMIARTRQALDQWSIAGQDETLASGLLKQPVIRNNA